MDLCVVATSGSGVTDGLSGAAARSDEQGNHNLPVSLRLQARLRQGV
jgi:hypothetical protein